MFQTLWSPDAADPPNGFRRHFGTGVPPVQRCVSATENLSTPARPVLVERADGGVRLTPDAIRDFTPHREIEDQVAQAYRYARFAGAIEAKPRIRDALRLPTGWLTALDAGEFGGGVWWFGDDRAVDRLFGGTGGGLNGVRLIRAGDSVFAATGLHHLGGSEPGRIVEFTYEAGQGVRLAAIFPLPVGARDLAHHDGVLIAVGSMGPMVIGRDGLMRHAARRDLLYKGLDGLQAFDPSGHSVVVDDDGVVLIGGHGGFSVFRKLPTGFTFDYYALLAPCTSGFEASGPGAD